MNRWKNAVISQDMSRMKVVHGKLLEHIGAIYQNCKIDQKDLEAEGLGLRPLSVAEHMGKSERNVLARRYYRLGQWSEALQGGYWLTVYSIFSSLVQVLMVRIRTRRCFDITR
jgi:FKBP12-rapamycin complex-associated protein